MRLRTGKDIYKVPRRFDRIEGASISRGKQPFMHYTLQPIVFVEMLTMRNKSEAARRMRGQPQYIAIEPAANKVWLYPAPDRPYDLTANLSEMFQI